MQRDPSIQGTWAATSVALRLLRPAPNLTGRLQPLVFFEAQWRLSRRSRVKRRRSGASVEIPYCLPRGRSDLLGRSSHHISNTVIVSPNARAWCPDALIPLIQVNIHRDHDAASESSLKKWPTRPNKATYSHPRSRRSMDGKPTVRRIERSDLPTGSSVAVPSRNEALDATNRGCSVGRAG